MHAPLCFPGAKRMRGQPSALTALQTRSWSSILPCMPPCHSHSCPQHAPQPLCRQRTACRTQCAEQMTVSLVPSDPGRRVRVHSRHGRVYRPSLSLWYHPINAEAFSDWRPVLCRKRATAERAQAAAGRKQAIGSRDGGKASVRQAPAERAEAAAGRTQAAAVKGCGRACMQAHRVRSQQHRQTCMA